MGNSTSTVIETPSPIDWSTKRDNSHSVLPLHDLDFMDMILSFLGFQDLRYLGRTCKELYLITLAFINRKSRSIFLDARLRRYIEGIVTPLAIDEALKLQLVNDLRVSGLLEKVFPQTEDSGDNQLEISFEDRRLLWYLFKERCSIGQIMSRLETVQRISLTDTKHVYFPHRGSRYIPVVDAGDILKRSVCKIWSVCWLEAVTTFNGVGTGLYCCAMVLRADFRCRMPHSSDDKTRWAVSVDNNEIVTVVTPGTFMKSFQKMLLPNADSCNGLRVERLDDRCPLRKFQTPDPDAASHNDQREELREFWMRICTPSFEVTKDNSTVAFSFKDVECPLWKSGLIFDLAELVRLS